MNNSNDLEDYMKDMLQETPAEENKTAVEYTKDDWDRWEREVIKEAQALIDECKD